MKNIIQFHISKGARQYVAQGVGVSIVTQGKTLDDLVKNIREAVDVHFADEDGAEHGFGKRPSVLLNYELPQVCHG